MWNHHSMFFYERNVLGRKDCSEKSHVEHKAWTKLSGSCLSAIVGFEDGYETISQTDPPVTLEHTLVNAHHDV